MGDWLISNRVRHLDCAWNILTTVVFFHPPSVMASVGMELKLKLKAGAIPTIFPETEAYKASKKAPLNPNDLGPGKHNRAKYGAYSKRNQKPVIMFLMTNLCLFILIFTVLNNVSPISQHIITNDFKTFVLKNALTSG